MRNMLIRPSREELEHFHPDYVIYNAGSFPANRFTTGMTSATSVSINFAEKEMVILGTEYAGEMKKGVFTVLFYEMPVKHNVLTLHSSANEGKDGDVTVFFGLSGTGKTTLSADSKRALIGDDEHCWSDRGIFNIEGGVGYSNARTLEGCQLTCYPVLRQMHRLVGRERARYLQRYQVRFGLGKRGVQPRYPYSGLR